jgi:hypothetical protein
MFSIFLLSFVLLPASRVLGQPSPRTPNNYPVYTQLRRLLPGGETTEVKEFVLKRDAAVFTFHSGAFAFYGEVNGKITGAVFRGQEVFTWFPPLSRNAAASPC